MTFASQGLPEMVVSDNGPAFVSKEFEEFLRKNGVRHVTSAPYHPSSNGLVERVVQTFKQAMKKQKGSLQTRLSRFLFKYRITPHTTTGQAPVQLRWGTQLRSHLSLIQSDPGKTMRYAQNRQKVKYDQHSKPNNFSIGDEVWVRSYTAPEKWSTGKVIEETGPVSAKIAMEDSRVVRRHHDQIRRQTNNQI